MQALVLHVPEVRLITPPDGVNDAREWVRRGATPADVEAAIARAEVHRLSVVVADGRTM